MKYNKIYIKKFRNLRDIEFNLGKKITVISGINGIGKSSILSLLSSSTGTSDKRLSTSSKFHPEFNDFFTISDSEEISSYLMYVEFDKSITIDGKDYPITKRIGFRDDRNSDRGIRVNPRNSNTINMIKAGLKTPTQSKFNDELKKIGITESKRIQTPTIYVSLSRLFPVGETNIKTELLDKRTNFYKKGCLTYYTNMYNAILPNSISTSEEEPTGNLLIKDATSKKRFHVDLKNASAETQSVGQDNVGAIVSALTDFYALKESDDSGSNYKGGILCIDEIDSSLHPSALRSLFFLLQNACDELNLQIIVTTHSLTILKEIIKLQQNNSDDFKLVYFKDPSLPRIDRIGSYEALKADLFDNITYKQPKLKVYCEDDASVEISKILNKLCLHSTDSSYPELEYISSDIGHGQLKLLPENDDYFKQVVILLDGDAKFKDKFDGDKAMNKTRQEFEKGLTSINFKKENILSLPTFYSPEVYIFNILKEYTDNPTKYHEFWLSLEAYPELSNYTVDKIKRKMLNNKTYKDIHENKQWRKNILDFVQKSDLLRHYYQQDTNKHELNEYKKRLYKAIKAASRSKKNRLF